MGAVIKSIQTNGLGNNKVVNMFYLRLPNIDNTYLRYGYHGPIEQDMAIEKYGKLKKLKEQPGTVDQSEVERLAKEAGANLGVSIVWQGEEEIDKSVKSGNAVKF